ncbi:MAG: IS110 family transposase [Lewinellaceae bacterium]|nr:IS110 family transposase [Lewinellaceae bacterium]
MAKQILKQSVGLDVSKDTIAACFSQQETARQFRILSSRTFASNASGFQQMHRWISRQRHQSTALHLLMEATGVYYEELAYFLQENGYRVCVLLPNKSSAFAKSLDYKSKTDKVDAKKLAQMSLERDLPKWTPPGALMLKIKRLCRERQELIDEKTALGNRLHAKEHSHAPEKSSIKRAKAAIKFFEKQISETEQAIMAAVEQDACIKQKLEKVCSIKGVGIITAATIVSEANGFVLFKNKAQLVSYAGYDVVENQSGTSLNSPAKISKKGNHHIRKALYFPAWTAIKHLPELETVYRRVFDKTKIKMKAAVAVQRKLLVLIYTLYKNNQTFDLNYQSVKKPNKPH